MRGIILAAAGALLLPAAVLGQGNPSNPGDFINNPHPGMPWTGLTQPGKENFGGVIRYIEVPAQQVQIPVYVPGPGSFPGEFVQQAVEIPGYVVTETTTGFIYPERLALQQITPGAYQWVRLPQAFQPK